MPILGEDADLRKLLSEATTIAVVGLSPDPSRDSHAIGAFLQRLGYRILPVNPMISTVLGERSWPDLARLPVPPDIVDIFRRPEHVPALVEEAISIGARAIWMQLGVGNAAAALRASDAGLAVVMNRCILVEHRRLLSAARTPDRS
jgi:predicted CoA-binding protein